MKGFFEKLVKACPSLPFLALGVWLAWAYIAYSGTAWLSDTEMNGANISTMYIVSTLTFGIVLLASTFRAARIRQLLDRPAVVIAGGAFASLGCLVIVLIGPYYLTKVLPYDLITALFYIASACTGLGTAVVGLKCGQLYGAIAPRKAILYTALSHVAIAVIYFTVIGSPSWQPVPGGSSLAGILAFVGMPLAAAGDMTALLGISMEAVQQDMMTLADILQEEGDGGSVWKKYREWKGEAAFIENFQLKNGERVQLTISRSADGLYDLFCFCRITKLYRQIAGYEKRLERLEEESRSKTTFLSRMSHEIRTPMNGIIGMLTLAENKLEANSPAMQYLTKADELSDHLIALINDILDMSRIEVGKVELEQGVFSLRALGNRLYDMFAKNLDSRGIRYEVNFEGVTVDYVCGDELRISQVIINFLSNAVKFTSEGEIIVTFRQMMLQNGVADWCSMRQRLDLVCLVY